MKKHGKKMVAPLVITACIVIYYVVMGIVIVSLDGLSSYLKILILAIPAAIIGVCIFVLRERIKEIRSGEEDDLGNY
ncbi:MAG: hypothetical protein FWG32_03885 [Oscillospiraceae bacterium]|nr:hypothetical protein [Oscillospiraceae bacterium]